MLLSTAGISPGESRFKKNLWNIENLSRDIEQVSSHSTTCKGICRINEEVGKEGLASAFIIQCDKCEQKFYLESSNKVKGRRHDMRST